MHRDFRGLGKKIWIFVMSVVGAGVLGSTALLSYSSSAAQQVVINEVCSNNFSVIYDESGNYSDYVELYNPAFVPVSLTGFSLSDNRQERDEHLLDSVIIGPRDYFLIWLDGSTDDTVGHADFKISRNGEAVYLSNADGEIIDFVEVPKLEYNTSFSRDQDGEQNWQRKKATAGASNNEAEILPSIELNAPFFSVESGFYEDEFELLINAGEGETVYYTLDGSNPTSDSIKYQGPIRIEDPGENENVYAARTDLSPMSDYVPPFKVDKAVVVRAIACNESGTAVSEIRTETYFLNYGTKTEYEEMPVISLVVNPDSLFDYFTGIYVNGAALEEYKRTGEGYLYMASNAYNSGKQWEREASFQYFDAKHELQLTQEVGIRISGESTRNVIQKSFKVYARDIYDSEGQFAYDFFPGIAYSSIKLRNGGTDNDRSKIMDPFLQSLVKERGVAIQDSMPCVVFLNGEYWGIYNLRERYQEEYIKNHYDVSEQNIWMIDSGRASGDGDRAWYEYDRLLQSISGLDMTVPENYVWANEVIDMQSFIDFYCINLYIDNNDVAFDKNMGMWRSKQVEQTAYGDTRWRFMLFDLDGALDGYDNNTFEESEWWKEDFDLMDEILISTLIRNEDFKEMFCVSFMDIANTVFSYERVHAELEKWRAVYQMQVVKSHQRFINADIGEEEYLANIEKIDEFFNRRFDYITEYLAQEFSLTGSLEQVKIETNQPDCGSIKVNTASICPEGEWIGWYYTDYPITVTAIANPGYKFVGWSGDLQSLEEQIEVEIPAGGITLQAEFEKAD